MTIFSSALICLALNVYHEARSEIIPGQYAVAQVTMNRAGQDRNKVCEVVMQKRQFSWTHSKVAVQEGGFKLRATAVPHDEEAWQKAVVIASVMLAGKIGDLTDGAKFYHEKSVSPKWANGMQKVSVIGAHVFYKQ